MQVAGVMKEVSTVLALGKFGHRRGSRNFRSLWTTRNSQLELPAMMLPLELERDIFILATDSAQRACTFMQVSHRVHNW
jgi:hypothetical protein